LDVAPFQGFFVLRAGAGRGWGGLNRDGRDFEIYRMNPENPLILAILVQTEGGLKINEPFAR